MHDARGYVFLDESGVTTDLVRRYGRSPRGLRLRDYAPYGHWQTHTVIAALRVDGRHAPAVFDGPRDRAASRKSSSSSRSHRSSSHRASA